MDKLTDERIEKYFNITEKALKKIKIKTDIKVDLKKVAEDYLNLSECYYKDAKYFLKKGEKVNAFAAICYAHAFLDAGARLGVFDVHDSKLFMVD